MSASAWADYLDARTRLVHQWTAEGLAFAVMVQRLTPLATDLAVEGPSDPPLPGSSRAQLGAWRARAGDLETELRERDSPAPETDRSQRDAEVLRASHVRALMSHPDPAQCGCQYWSPPPALGTHHPRCAYPDEPRE